MSNPIEKRQSTLLEAFAFVELVYFTVVREVRQASGNATLGLLVANLRIITMVMIFYVMFTVIGVRSSPVRGDMFLFLLSGVQIFLMHNSAINAVTRAGSAISPMMMHAPMTTSLRIIASTLGELYLNVLAGLMILTGLYLYHGGLDIYQPQYALIPWILGWMSGVVIGLLFLLIRPLMPDLMPVLSLAYQRANLISSGKFWVANMLPASIVPYFDWNPLFHAIDQTRGFVFVNYSPHKTSMEYVIWFVIIGLVIGMMGEFWLRKTQSRSSAATQ